ncbi:MAG: hypothetical protein LBL86_02465, partial [Coriobacteriales bacterium]|nr:hypothetical protein [Coriobacteriales bacterium]
GAGQTRPFPRFRLVEARKWSTGKGFRGVYIVSLIGKVLFIRKAVQAFGVGNVRSALLVGLEAEHETIEGVKMLLGEGCLPMLSPFIPDVGTDLSQYKQPEPELQLSILYHAAELTKEAGHSLAPSCKPCTHNTLSLETC